jgi:uncharacterized protein
MLVDSLKLVRERQRLAGVLAVAGLPRLVQSLHGLNGIYSGDGSLDYAISGDTDARERPLLRVRVSGTVLVQCQRCLEAMAHEVRVDSAVRLVAAEKLDAEYEAIGADPDEPDCIVASKTMDVAALIEDEVLLALPPYPRHDVSVCKGKVDPSAITGVNVMNVQAGNVVNAFSAFSALQSMKPK